MITMGGKSSNPTPPKQTVPGSKRNMLPEEKKAADDRMKLIADSNSSMSMDSMGDTTSILGGL